MNTTALSATPRRLSALFVALEPELHRVRPDGHGAWRGDALPVDPMGRFATSSGKKETR